MFIMKSASYGDYRMILHDVVADDDVEEILAKAHQIKTSNFINYDQPISSFINQRGSRESRRHRPGAVAVGRH